MWGIDKSSSALQMALGAKLCDSLVCRAIANSLSSTANAKSAILLKHVLCGVFWGFAE